MNQANSNEIAHNMTPNADNWDHMVYVRLFEGCNLFCEHCFIPSNPKKIKESFYENNGLTNELFAKSNIKEGDKIYLQWHGGEPTMLGVEYLENAIKNIEADKRLSYQHGIQTNLMNFSDNPQRWADFYAKYFNSHIGVSWDASIRHMNRKTINQETNEEFEEKFWANLKLASSMGLKFYMVVTATKVFFQKFKNPIDFFELMVENGITHLNLERITKNGNARLNWDKLGLTNKEYSEYMSKFFKYYRLFKTNNPSVVLNISPFDGLMVSVVNKNQKEQQVQNKSADIWDIMSYKNQGYGCWSGQCDTRFHTIDSNGYKYGCTALTSEQDNSNKALQSKVGSELQKIVWIGKSNKEQRDNIIGQRQSRQEACQTCEFLSICSSGCLSVEKFDESMECSGAKTLFKTIDNYVKKMS